MTEAAFVVWLTVLGVIVLVPAARSLPGYAMALAAPIVGMAAYVVAGVALAAVSGYSTLGAISLATGTAMGAVAVWYLAARPPLPLRQVLIAALSGTLLAVGVAVAAQSMHLTRLTTDSFGYMISASILERSGSLDDVVPLLLKKRQLATPMVHTVGFVTGKGYAASTTPLIAVSAVASTIWLAERALRRLGTAAGWRIAIGAVALAALLTTNRVLFHAFYINGHMLFAGLLLVGVGFAWYEALSGRWHLAVPAALAFAALVPLRAEAVIVAVIFLVPIVTAVATPQWVSWMLATPLVAVTLVWDVATLPRFLPADDLAIAGPIYGNVIIAAGLVVVVALRHVRPVRRSVRFAPWLVLGGVAAYVAVQAWRDFDLLFDSVSALSSALGATGRWSAFWWVVPVLFVAVLLAGVVPLDRFFSFGIVTFVVALFSFAYMRGSSYGSHPGDSANRMIMHLTLLLILYLMVGAGEAAVRTGAEAPRASTPTEVPGGGAS